MNLQRRWLRKIHFALKVKGISIKDVGKLTATFGDEERNFTILLKILS
jgi:hypothetical protein